MSILNRVFGDPDLLNLDEKIKNLITKIPSQETPSSLDDNTGKVIDKFLEGDFKQAEISKLFQEVSVPQERIARYNVYDEVNKGIPLIRRILKVYLSNILPKNPVTGKSIIFRKTNKQGSDEHVNYQEKAETFINEILTKYDLIKKLKDQVLPKQLLYGDIFIEIISLLKEQSKVDLNNQSNITGSNVLLESNNPIKNVLMESQLLLKDVQTISDNDFKSRIDSTLIKLSDLIIETDDSIIDENILSTNDDSNEPDEQKLIDELPNKYKKVLHDILIRVHKPHNIVILETKYGSTLGYLEISKKVESGDMSIGQNLSQVVDKITNVGKRTDFNQDKIVNKLIFYILRKVVNTQMKKIDPTGSGKTDIDTVVQSLGPDVYSFIKRLFVEQGIYKKENQVSQMRVKFIPSSNMIHFSNTSNDYAPYGESLIEGLILPSKLYMLAQLANTISKLSRASVIRKWTIDKNVSSYSNI